jgi:hypothetical protein
MHSSPSAWPHRARLFLLSKGNPNNGKKEQLTWNHITQHKNRLGLRLRREIFYQTDNGSLLMATLPYLSHWPIHMSSSSTKELIQSEQPLRPPRPAFLCTKISSISKALCERCNQHAQNNPRQGLKVPPQRQSVGGPPLENLTMEFTEMPWAQRCKYLLVFVCTFSGWVEVFPTGTEKAQEVSRCLLKDIISQFGISVSVGPDNGPAFVVGVL